MDALNLDFAASLRGIHRLLAEPGVTDLVLNGHENTLMLRSARWLPVASPIRNADQLAEFARQLAGLARKRLDLAMPYANFVIDGKVRVHCVLESAISKVTAISFRVLGERAFGLDELHRLGMVDDTTRSRLRSLMRSGASLLISGPSGSGKTTLLRALLLEVADRRVLAVEDIDELKIESANFLSLQPRQSNVEGKGEIDLNALLIETLRMRPDHLVVGEVRSVELFTLLQAANTGHSVLATIHSNSAAQVVERMASIAALHGISVESVKHLAANAIQAFAHVSIENGKRQISLRGASV